MNVIVIAPHPDDEILGCGGTIAAHCAAGDHVTVVLLTRGNPAIFPPDLIARTREEFRQVHNMLGYANRFFWTSSPRDSRMSQCMSWLTNYGR